jgi:hypothetical protein
VHKDARLTPKGRGVMLDRLKAGQHQVDVAQATGISLQNCTLVDGGENRRVSLAMRL